MFKLLKNKALLIPLLLMIVGTLVSIFAVVGMTYAWESEKRQNEGDAGNVVLDIPVNVFVSDVYVPTSADGKFSLDDFETNGFDIKLTVSPENALFPSTTIDGINYKYALSVNANGQATLPTGGARFAPVSDDVKNYYCIEKEIYFATLSTRDVNIFLSNVIIEAGIDNSNIYRAVRVAAVYTYEEDGVEYTNTIIIREKEYGEAYPASNANNNDISSSDPSVPSGQINNNLFRVKLPAVEKSGTTTKVSPEKVVIRIWIEGQNDFALVDYSGTAFKVTLKFDALEK